MMSISLVCVSTLVFAQTSDQLLNDLVGTGTTNWGYNISDKDKIVSLGLSWSILNLEVPVAKKDGKIMTTYYITRWPNSYADIAKDSSQAKFDKLRDSATFTNGNKPVYEVVGEKLILALPLEAVNGDLYISIDPQDEFDAQGNRLEDYKINLDTISTTQVKAENFSNASSNKAIANVSCIWTKDQNRVNLTWSVNTAMSATKVEISHRGDTNQWPMDVKGTPAIGDKTFTMHTPHRNIQLFRLKPVDNNGTMIGEEIQYICKPDTVVAAANTPTDPTKPIPVTPHTGPKETFTFIMFVSALAYVVYKKTRKA